MAQQGRTQKFCKGGEKLGYFKKRGGGAAASSVRRSTGKNEFGNFKGGEIDTRGGGDAPPTPLNTPWMHMRPTDPFIVVS